MRVFISLGLVGVIASSLAFGCDDASSETVADCRRAAGACAAGFVCQQVDDAWRCVAEQDRGAAEVDRGVDGALQGGSGGSVGGSGGSAGGSGGSAGGSGGSAGGSGGSGGACEAWPGATWREPVDAAALDPSSAQIISWLHDQGGFGFGRLQIDFSLQVMEVPAGQTAPLRAFAPTDEHYDPDCDLDAIPIPLGGAVEGNEGYQCDSDGDCHLIVLYHPTGQLFEMWRANLAGDGQSGAFDGGCLAVWDVYARYGEAGRGVDCTSADAAGLPITPLLFTADEVAAGQIDHAIRFILPNDRIRSRMYVPPATHSTPSTSGGDLAPPYGARFRLREDFPVESLATEGARVVARGLQRFGMILADAGSVALTARSDRFTTAKWAGLLGSRDLDGIQMTDFEVVALPPTHRWTDCARVARPEPLCAP